MPITAQITVIKLILASLVSLLGLDYSDYAGVISIFVRRRLANKNLHGKTVSSPAPSLAATSRSHRCPHISQHYVSAKLPQSVPSIGKALCPAVICYVLDPGTTGQNHYTVSKSVYHLLSRRWVGAVSVGNNGYSRHQCSTSVHIRAAVLADA